MTQKLCLVLLIPILFLACGQRQPSRPPQPETVKGLSLVEVNPATATEWLETVGTVRAAQSSIVSSQITANILRINVREGDRVRRGQVLAVLDVAGLRASLDGAKAALSAAQQQVSSAAAGYNLAEATLNRYQELFQKKSVSPQEFDEVKARRQQALARRDSANAEEEQAQAAVQQAQIMLSHTTLTAPRDGIVVEKRADAGTLATPAMPLLVIEDSGPYRLEVSVDEDQIRLVHPGQKAPVSLGAPGMENLEGRVAEIVPAANPSSRTFTVKIALPPDARIRSGLFGRARFPRGERQVLRVPHTAVVERGQLHAVYVAGPSRIASLRYVSLGQAAGDDVEVLSGLTAGERVVLSPGDRDLGGKRIGVQP